MSDHRRVLSPLLSAAARQEGTPLPKFSDDDALVPHYLAYLDSSQDALLRLFRALAEPGGTPALLHCTAGKDRTGAAVMMLLDALGVQREAIVADYVADAERLDEVFDVLTTLSTYGARLAAIPVEAKRAIPETAERFLTVMATQFGGSEGWLMSAGFADAELTALRDQFLTA